MVVAAPDAGADVADAGAGDGDEDADADGFNTSFRTVEYLSHSEARRLASVRPVPFRSGAGGAGGACF